MAWTVDKIWGLASSLVNKAQTANFTPSNFFYFWNSEQRMYKSDMEGRFQARANGKQGANTGLIENATILTKLAPFTKTATLPVVAGSTNRPSDFILELAVRINGYESHFINKGQIATVNRSVIDPPSITNNMYYHTMYEGQYTVLPSAVTSMDLDYICDVQDVVYATIPDGNGRPIYDPGSSVNPLWDTPSAVEITRRTLKSFGVHYSSADFQQYANGTIQTGN